MDRAPTNAADQGGVDSAACEADNLTVLAQQRYEQNDRTTAEALYRWALALREREGDHAWADTVSVLERLAELCEARGAHDETEAMLTKALATVDRPAADPDVVAPRVDALIRFLVRRGKHGAAEPLLARLLAIKQESGAEPSEIIAVLTRRAEVRTALGQHDAAERLLRQALAVLGAEGLLHRLADAVAAQGRESDAEAIEGRTKPFAVNLERERPDVLQPMREPPGAASGAEVTTVPDRGPTTPYAHGSPSGSVASIAPTAAGGADATPLERHVTHDSRAGREVRSPRGPHGPRDARDGDGRDGDGGDGHEQRGQRDPPDSPDSPNDRDDREGRAERAGGEPAAESSHGARLFEAAAALALGTFDGPVGSPTAPVGGDRRRELSEGGLAPPPDRTPAVADAAPPSVVAGPRSEPLTIAPARTPTPGPGAAASGSQAPASTVAALPPKLPAVTVGRTETAPEGRPSAGAAWPAGLARERGTTAGVARPRTQVLRGLNTLRSVAGEARSTAGRAARTVAIAVIVAVVLVAAWMFLGSRNASPGARLDDLRTGANRVSDSVPLPSVGTPSELDISDSLDAADSIGGADSLRAPNSRGARNLSSARNSSSAPAARGARNSPRAPGSRDSATSPSGTSVGGAKNSRTARPAPPVSNARPPGAPSTNPPSGGGTSAALPSPPTVEVAADTRALEASVDSLVAPVARGAVVGLPAVKPSDSLLPPVEGRRLRPVAPH